MKADAELKHGKWSMSMFAEDWNSSQFWYSESTARALAEELLDGATPDTRVALVSAPSVFVQMKNLLLDKDGETGSKPRIALLEFDDRFSVFNEFVHYDFEQPLRLDPGLKGKFDRILCDPPFLSTDCQTKAAMTVRWLAKDSITQGSAQFPRIIVCTGERMEEIVHRLYPCIKTTTFEPEHEQGRLGNEFRCYANYASNLWTVT